MAFTYAKLHGRIIQKYGSLNAFIAVSGMPGSRVYAKLNNEAGFSKNDIEKWAALLEISTDSYGIYFFT